MQQTLELLPLPKTLPREKKKSTQINKIHKYISDFRKLVSFCSAFRLNRFLIKFDSVAEIIAL
jgi:hypothetical protein